MIDRLCILAVTFKELETLNVITLRPVVTVVGNKREGGSRMREEGSNPVEASVGMDSQSHCF